MSEYKSLNSLMKHMREHGGLKIGGSTEKKALAHIGYFHGYKGYRYSGDPTKKLPLTSFKELEAVIDFDTDLKTLLYPVLMKTEMTMKNLALVEMMDAAGSSSLEDLYGRLMPGGDWEKQKRKLEVIHNCNKVLLGSYKGHSQIICHYYDSPRGQVPVWALMEVLTLGQFGKLLLELSDRTLSAIAACWGLKRNDGNLVPHVVHRVTDLRNAVAHNGVIYDTRFGPQSPPKILRGWLERELKFRGHIDYGSITDYMLLVSYLARCLGSPKREVYGLARQFRVLTDSFRGAVSTPVFDLVVHTDNRAKIDHLEGWIRTS